MEWNTGSYEYSPRHRLPGSNTPAGSNAARGRRRAYVIEALLPGSDQGRISDDAEGSGTGSS
jgi:hypothetical protein